MPAPRRPPRLASKTRTAWLGAALLCVAAPLQAFDLFNDPFNTGGAVSAGAAGNALGGKPCQDGPVVLPLSLLDAVERALCRNPKTRQSWADVKTRAAAVGAAQAAYLPTLNAAASRSKVVKDTRFPGFPLADSRLDTNSNDVNLNLSWVLFDFGLRAASLENARQLLNAANAAQDDVLQTVFLQTVQRFYDAQAGQALLTAALEAEQAAAQVYQASEAKYAAGVGVLADKLQAQTSYAQTTLKRSQTAGDLQNAWGELASAMGLRPDTRLQLAGMADEVADAPLFRRAVDELMADAVRTHPKILAAKAQLNAAQAQIAAVRAEGRPRVSLFASGERSDTPINQVSTKQIISSRSIGIQINIPITDGFNRSYQIRGAQHQAEGKAAELADIEQQVALEVWKSERALATLTEDIQTTKILIGSARQSFDVAQGRYRAGAGSILELLKAQSDLAGAQQQGILTLAHWQQARSRLAASLARLTLDGL
jgi:outer membrane protein